MPTPKKNTHLCDCKTGDDYTTHTDCIDSLLQFIPKDKIIWESAYCDGKSGEHIRNLGYDVYHNDEDFYKYQPDKWDIQITNPPFLHKKNWIKRSVELGKPWCLILPFATLGTMYFNELVDINDDRFQLLVSTKKRFKFVKRNPDNSVAKNWTENGCGFDVCWFCWDVNLPKKLNTE